ncbi:hypothetical protein ABIC28_001412 [Rhodococcus sp. PvR044]|jgi:hypothetical protein|uniref:hypothetical protein n=1 Tax=Rhodococcus TaxID=1827 RepID=UPI000BC81B87|nr:MULTISPECIES: hypothetical protein [Rhodococcus]MBP1161568.1 hypothetical protein [Rhodococcus sp. PvR099]MCZ4555799.1 hypothetical protein [Rhodococcus maanshanensis]PTR44736.1 hypothetical protein C8K38_103233 [Rhodococcus sp. OK611]SNX90177.1 hypothetical protein SAMN05447004_104233 [Rhodococcus sp. OK270]
MSSASQISEQAVVLAMDYGLFSLSGGLADFEDELELLAQAQAAQPCAGDGKALVVLSPHQNNFEIIRDASVSSDHKTPGSCLNISTCPNSVSRFGVCGSGCR